MHKKVQLKSGFIPNFARLLRKQAKFALPRNLKDFEGLILAILRIAELQRAKGAFGKSDEDLPILP